MAYEITSTYILRQVGETYYLVNVGQEGMPYEKPVIMNETGAEFWKMIQNGLEQDELVNQIVGEYEIPREDAVKDVEQFLLQLRNRGVVR